MRAITVSDKFNEYAAKVIDQLRNHGVRAEFDHSSDTLGKKIRTATKLKIPNVLVIGEQEQTHSTVTLRCYGQEEQLNLTIDEFEKMICEQIRTRAKKKKK